MPINVGGQLASQAFVSDVGDADLVVLVSGRDVCVACRRGNSLGVSSETPFGGHERKFVHGFVERAGVPLGQRDAESAGRPVGGARGVGLRAVFVGCSGRCVHAMCAGRAGHSVAGFHF